MTEQTMFGKKIVETDATEIEEQNLPRDIDEALLDNLDSFDRYLIFRIATENEGDIQYTVNNDLELSNKDPRGITKIIVDAMIKYPDIEHGESETGNYVAHVAAVRLEYLASEQKIVVEQLPFPLKQSRIGIHPDYVHTASQANIVGILYDLLGMVSQAKCDANNVPVGVIGPIEPAFYQNNTYGGIKLSLEILRKLTDGKLKAEGRMVRTNLLHNIEEGISRNYTEVYTKNARGYSFDEEALVELSQSVQIIKEEFSTESNCLSRLKKDTDFMDALKYAHHQLTIDVKYLVETLE